MKERDINNILMNPNSYNPSKKNVKTKDVIALDTETQNGKCFLLGYQTKQDSFIHLIKSAKDILEILTNRKFTKCDNFFYNLTYDFQAIIKLLPYENLNELAKIDKTTYKDYVIKTLPNKMFSIKNLKTKKVSKFFDLAQFYNHMKLDTVGAKYLGYKKVNLKDHNIDITKLDVNRYETDLKYKSILNKYLIRDCKITYDAGIKLKGMIKPYINPKGYYSQASFSQQYFTENLKRKLNLPPKSIIDYALKSYQGGRFETIKRGYFKKTYIADIKSAYPFHNTQIPDTSKGTWKTEYEYDSAALIGLYKISTDIYDINISPLKYQLKNGLMIYPIGKYKEVYVNKKELELLDKLGYKYKIDKCYQYYDNNPTYPFKFLEKFYNLKEKYKKEGKKDLSLIPKIIINGFYGKTIQITPDLYFSKTKLKNNKDLVDMLLIDNEYYYVYKRYKAGKLFNPIVANEITSNTRVQLFNSSYKHLDNVIGFQTDSIISDKKLNINYSDKLGGWEMDSVNKEMVILGSGVYQVLNDNKIRVRGFQKNIDLNNLLNDNLFTNKISVHMKRNVKLKSTVKSKMTTSEKMKEFNLIKDISKNINLNFDKKRVWDRNFINSKDVLENQIHSKPILIS